MHQIESDKNRPNEKRYVIAFIDDRTRYVVHHEIIHAKISLVISETLEKAIRKVSRPPHCITIDNGGEFIGHDFQCMLKKYSIIDHRTHPYTPQENGKIGGGGRWNASGIQILN